MTRKLIVLPRAEHDAESIFQWLSERSPEGAIRWWTAFEEAAQRLVGDPERFAVATESELASREVRQFLFKTRRGRTYRGLFVVVGNEIRVLRIRGPGQPPLEADEIEREL